MTLMSRVAILAISLVPMCAQAKQPSAVKLKSDAQNVAKIISGDEFKTQAYCEIVELGGQIGDEQDATKAEELRQKATKLEEALGPEFIALVSSLKGVNPNSRDAQEISSILDPLDELCGMD
jgi:hypothetical protein